MIQIQLSALMSQQPKQELNNKTFTQKYEELKSEFFNKYANYFDMGYRYAKAKYPKTQDDEQFVSNFQQIFVLQMVSMLNMGLTSICGALLLYSKRKSKVPSKVLLISFLFFAGNGIISTIQGMNLAHQHQVFDKMDKYTKQMQQIMKEITPEDISDSLI